MDERIILNIEKPLLRTWSSESHLMSMILAQENAERWIFNNYINLLGYQISDKNQNLLAFFPKHNPMENEVPINAWTGCPFLQVHMVSPSYIKNVDIVEYVIHSIQNGFYIYLDLCQEYLKTRLNTSVHKTFVYGFDKVSKRFYVADHYNSWKYSLAEVTFDEFVQAYNAVHLNGEENSFDLKKGMYETSLVVLARPKAFKYEFNLKWFEMQLEDYLNSTYSLDCVVPLTVPRETTMYFGISSYDLIMNYVDGILKNKESVKMDWRIFTLICDHKKILNLRNDFFRKLKICNFTNKESERYEKLYQSSEILLNLFLKTIATGEDNHLKKIKNICIEMKRNEFDLLQQLRMKIHS